MRNPAMAPRITAALAGAGLLPLAFPPAGWWFLVFPAYGLLFWALLGASARTAFYLAFLHGALGSGLSLLWFFNIFDRGAIPLYLLLALFQALASLGIQRVWALGMKGSMQVLLTAMFWTGVEFYRAEWFVLRFPWITPGTALGPIWLTPWVGVYGTTFAVIAGLAALVRRESRPVGFVVTMLLLASGGFRPGLVNLPDSHAVEVMLVQTEESSFDTAMAMTEAALVKAQSDLIVWPEYAVSYDIREHPRELAALKRLCARFDATLVLGTKTRVGEGEGDWYNTALVVEADGVCGATYKSRPVHLFNDGLPGKNPQPIETRLGRIGTPICFDCDFTAVTRRLAAQGANLFAVPSYDAAWWGLTQRRQHAELFRLRAAETGTWLACAASSGVTQVVDPHGNVRHTLPVLDPGVCVGRMGVVASKTFYTRAGWLFPWICLAGTVAMPLVWLVCRIHSQGRAAVT